jgi:hypothetical protein
MSKKIIIILFFLNGCVTENTARNWVNKCIEDAEEYVNWQYPKCIDAYMNYYIKYCEFNAPRQGFIFLKRIPMDIEDSVLDKNKPTPEELIRSHPDYGRNFKAQREVYCQGGIPRY